MNQKYHSYWKKSLSDLDPELTELIQLEKERQSRKLIFIPSESFCIAPIREATGSIFTNIYAEGYPRPRMREEPREQLSDYSRQLTHYRRYANRRFYKGTEYVDLLECLASRRIAECFANDQVETEDLLVNVQPLSGAAANNSVYSAILDSGDTIMGMNLTHGGHLTHGSPFNRSGEHYNAIWYEVDEETERLDYNRIQKKALEHEPDVIVAGWTSYPYAPDWSKFREIADSCGALLLADIAHTAGLIIGGAHPSPVGYADIINFTTHKTVFGPRGAVSITTDPDLHSQINRSVFPGEQGGPHPQKFAAMATAFKIAQKNFYRRLQKQTVQNASALANALQDHGLIIPHDGTDTHLFLADVSSIKPLRVGQKKNNPGAQEYELWGEVAARILDLAGVVVNKNTIPGDKSARDARGIRFGTPWVTQRGLKTHHMEQLASSVAKLLKNIYPFHYQGTTKRLSRGKVELDVLRSVRQEIAEISSQAHAEENDHPKFHSKDQTESSYPHYPYLKKTFTGSPDLESYHQEKNVSLIQSGGVQIPEKFDDPEEEFQAATNEVALFDLSDYGLFKIVGGRSEAFLQESSSVDLFALPSGELFPGLFLDDSGAVIDDAEIIRRGKNEFFLIAHPSRKADLLSWLRGLSDGYIVFDREDITRKVQGPAKVIDLQSPPNGYAKRTLLGITGPEAPDVDPPGNVQSYDGRFRYLPVQSDQVSDVWEALQEHENVTCAGIQARKRLRTKQNLPMYNTDNETITWKHFWNNDNLSEPFRPRIDLYKPYFVGQSLIEEEVNPGS